MASATLRQHEDPEQAVRAVAALLLERHPELIERPWTPVAEGLPEELAWRPAPAPWKGGA